MSKAKINYVCQECGHAEIKWCGRCPGCGGWNTMAGEVAVERKGLSKPLEECWPVRIAEMSAAPERRINTGNGELDRVLGGGVVPGSLILIGGDPGIGKSTLALQVANAVAGAYGRSLYITGEESPQQTRMRASRLGELADELFVVTETSVTKIGDLIEKFSPCLIVVDSIQTIFSEDLPSAPGSVAQVRECAGRLMQLAKSRGIPVLIIGHVTKDGFLAGPRVLEHMVDAVLYFEGEQRHAFRILRAVKNRFGSTNEIGVFEMGEHGLREIANPSAVFLSERPTGVSGSVVIASLEGTRPVLVEIQALVSGSTFGNPRRMTSGIDLNRLNLILAVLEKRMGMHFSVHDVYLNVVGGVKLDEPAVDLGIVVALASSLRDIPVDPELVVFGEVGLTGEVRGVNQAVKRINEGLKMGFRTFIIPAANLNQCQNLKKINVVGVDNVSEALDTAWGVKN